MDEAIKRLEVLLAEYEEGLTASFQSQVYYDSLRVKVATIEEALRRLRD